MSQFDPSEVDRTPFDEMDRQHDATIETWITNMGLEGQAAENFRNQGRHWILIDDEPVAVGMFEWLCWLESGDVADRRILERHEVMSPGGRMFTVSTVFLTLDHNYFPGGVPLLFETMIFDWDGETEHRSKRWQDFQLRYPTAAMARAGHMLAMEAVETGKDPLDDDG